MKRMTIGVLIFVAGVVAQSYAGAAEVAEVDIPHSPDAIRRGAEVISNVCMACHSLKFVHYRELAQLGFSGKQLDAIRGGNSLKQALMTGMSADMLRGSFGIVPPDLSLMANAREGGPSYIYDLLTGFYQKPDGSVDNHVFPGVKMPDVLMYTSAEDAAARAKVQEQAKDAAAFLNWAADPHADERHHLGYYVMVYLVILTILLYISKHRIWARLDKPAPEEG